MSTESCVANLEKVDHIVVLMMENRSFDHMLGYLSLTGGRADIDGLRPGLANEYQGRSYPVHHLTTTKVDVDPGHSASAVDVQIGDGRMGGFVASLAATIADSGVNGGDPSPAMGYYDGADVPVYDHLAEEFLVCDRWFSSVPGATWPNRLYALCGSAAGSRDDLPPHVPPMYHKPSFVRHLDEHGVSWRWYCFDTPTLRLADAHYTVRTPPPLRLLQQDRPELERQARDQDRREGGKLPRRRRKRLAAVGVLDRPSLYLLQPARFPPER